MVYRNAEIVVNGVALGAELHQLDLDIDAEMIDVTTFGNDTRINRGGLLAGAIAGAGFLRVDAAGGLEEVAFTLCGVDDTLFAVFPNGISAGSIGSGYLMRGIVSEFDLGDEVGGAIGVSFAAEGRDPG